MMKTGWSLLLSAMLAVVFCACSTGFSVRELTESDSGRTLTAKVGDRFVVSLPSNPTTGYTWSFGSPYDEKVVILSSDHLVNPDETAPVGAPGKRILTFSVVGPGKSGIRLEYKRPWERNVRPARVFQLLLFATGDAPKSIWEEEDAGTPRVDSKGRIVPEKKGVFD